MGFVSDAFLFDDCRIRALTLVDTFTSGGVCEDPLVGSLDDAREKIEAWRRHYNKADLAPPWAICPRVNLRPSWATRSATEAGRSTPRLDRELGAVSAPKQARWVWPRKGSTMAVRSSRSPY